MRTTSGQSTLLFVTVLCAIGTIFVMSSIDIYKKNLDYKTKDFDQVLLNEVTTSAFSLMESALARRLWEPPPDDRCLKSDSFNVSGSLPEGLSWKVTAHYNYQTKNFELLAEGTYKNLRTAYLKRIKVLDVSDYLLFSGSTDTVSLQRLYNEKSPMPLIAKDRRIYTRGPLSIQGNIDRANPKLNWNGTPAGWPGEYGTIVQADRMQFGGGIFYAPYGVEAPNPDGSNIVSLLLPYSYTYGTPQTHISQYSVAAVFTKNYSVATTLTQQVANATSGPLSKNDVEKNVYPVALFNGVPPLEAWRASDSGSYFNDLDKYSIFLYSRGGASNIDVRINATCISKGTAFADKKFCSHSEHFPRGFSAWRKNADLEGILFTSDAEEVPSPSFTWDNLSALEEDARQCGAVIEAPTGNAYTDCATWDKNFMKQYAATGNDYCGKVSPIDMENVTLNNFNPGDLTNASLKERLLRRVIYTKVPIELKQNDSRGLMLSALPNNVARNNMALWVVSEDTLALKGFQADQTSPLNSDPGRLREVVFNEDSSSGAKKDPISMVIFSPEQVHLLSPFYKPASYNYLTSYWPASGGKIHPILHNPTDYIRNEEDGFKYGFRTFRLSNIALITSTNVNSSNPFYLRGLWSSVGGGGKYALNECMVSLAGHQLTKNGATPLMYSAQVPSYNSDPQSPTPPASSRFYNGANTYALGYIPAVFALQKENGHTTRTESDVLFTGIRIHIDFESISPPGKRDLSTPLYDGADSLKITTDVPYDLSHKNFAWDTNNYYNPQPPGTPCLLSNIQLRGTSILDPMGITPDTNNGTYNFAHSSPPDAYRNVGSLVGLDQPVLETRGP